MDKYGDVYKFGGEDKQKGGFGDTQFGDTKYGDRDKYGDTKNLGKDKKKDDYFSKDKMGGTFDREMGNTFGGTRMNGDLF